MAEALVLSSASAPGRRYCAARSKRDSPAIFRSLLPTFPWPQSFARDALLCWQFHAKYLREFFWTSMIVSACFSRACKRSFSRRNAAISSASSRSAVFFGPRFLALRPSNSPWSRARRHRLRYDEYMPSRRTNAPISPGCVQASASFRMRSFSFALNRLCGVALTSGLSCSARSIIFSVIFWHGIG
jgi:hypothetical protein